MNSAHTFQRVGAYIIDIFIISIIISLFTLMIPTSEIKKNALKEEEKLIEKYSNKEIDANEYVDKSFEITYTIEKENIPNTLISMAITLGYFAIFAYSNKGKTLGKQLLHIKIVSEDNKEANQFQILFRTLLFHGCLSSIINVILLLFIKSNQFAYTIGIINIIQSIFVLSSLLMVVIGKQKRGLHDFICRTKVVEE